MEGDSEADRVCPVVQDPRTRVKTISIIFQTNAAYLGSRIVDLIIVAVSLATIMSTSGAESNDSIPEQLQQLFNKPDDVTAQKNSVVIRLFVKEAVTNAVAAAAEV